MQRYTDSYHTNIVRRIDVSALDPCCALGYFFRNGQEFQDFWSELLVVSVCVVYDTKEVDKGFSLFEVVDNEIDCTAELICLCECLFDDLPSFLIDSHII